MRKSIDSVISNRKFRFWLWVVCFSLIAALSLYYYKAAENHYWKFIESPAPETIQKIEFYAINGSKIQALVKVVRDPNTIEKISKYLSDAIPDKSSRRSYTEDVYVVFYLENGDKMGFIFSRLDKQQTVYVEFVTIDGMVTTYSGHAMIKESSFWEFLKSLGIFK